MSKKKPTEKLTSNNEDNQPVLLPDRNLTLEMEKDTSAGQEAAIVAEMVTTNLDYSHNPCPLHQPSALQDMSKV
jgi:hypothetical protein